MRMDDTQLLDALGGGLPISGLQVQRGRFEDVDFEQRGWVDHGEKVGSLLAPGDRFEFVFDFGDDWRHRCEVLAEKLDAREEFGELPSGPVILWGGGGSPTNMAGRPKTVRAKQACVGRSPRSPEA